MSHEVIMPALGMAQETGLLVAWTVSLGDKVAKGDILMEVETDKSTMEVEALADGFVTELRVEAGSDVPVGNVVAVISPTADAPVAEPAQPDAKVDDSKPAAPAPKPEPVAKPSPPTPTDGRILASPKARRLASERGLDLSKLVAAGVAQPYHVADLDVLETLPVASTGQVTHHIGASVPAEGFADFGEWLDGEASEAVSKNAIRAAFAASALRRETLAEAITVRVLQPALGKQSDFADPDKERFCALRAEAAAEPDLILHDLTSSRITSVRYGAQGCPVLSIAQKGGDYELSLSFTDNQLSAGAALAFLDGFAGRLEQPLRHLL